MLTSVQCFTPLTPVVKNKTHPLASSATHHDDEYGELPQRFTFPYYYTPDPLCEIAIKDLQQRMVESGMDESTQGNMYGVLLVQTAKGEVGYLTGYAGVESELDGCINAVPSVYDKQEVKKLALHAKKTIEQIEARLAEHTDRLLTEVDLLEQVTQQSKQEISAQQARMAEGKQRRKALRSQTLEGLSPEQVDALGRESSQEKQYLKRLKVESKKKMTEQEQVVAVYRVKVSTLESEVSDAKHSLQQQRFSLFRFQNQYGVEKGLDSLYNIELAEHIPNGLGECAIPKLLNAAFSWGLKPLAIAEFWWGTTPEREVRQHGNLYPVCQTKCFDILNHMLEGIDVDDSPLTVNPAEGRDMDIVYKDDAIVVVNKPAEFLSVPGKSITDSVYTRIRRQYPEATGPIIVHRLDMSTSGLIVFTLNADANKNIQKQFIERTVTKRYIAELEGDVKQDRGTINLPLCGDLDDRPRQLVCYKEGRSAETDYEVIGRTQVNGVCRTRIRLYPKTGRTHQLRVHCSHKHGLRVPIVGDDLYGYKADRLHLHAEYLQFRHPMSNELISFHVEAGF